MLFTQDTNVDMLDQICFVLSSVLYRIFNKNVEIYNEADTTYWWYILYHGCLMSKEWKIK
jgi:hypothetical protein